jgi:hypothetical protein
MRLRHDSWILVARCLALLIALASPTVLGQLDIGDSGAALAQPGPPRAPITQCSLRGQIVMPLDTPIVDTMGHAIARFSGASTALVANDFPSDAQGKVGIETGFGAGSFRVRGFVDSTRLSIFAASNIAVVPGHVWLSANRALTLVGAGGGRLRVEKKLSAPFQQTFRGADVCSSFSLEPGAPSVPVTAGNARGYQLKQESLDLYADASVQNLVTTLHRSPYVDAVLFFSKERSNSSVHVEYQGEVVIDGWAKADALSALPPGETMDQPAPALTQRSAPRVSIPGQPRLVRPSKEVPLRRAAKESEPAIGVIEPGAETYVLDQVAGWASVLPKSLNVLPAADAQFWAKSSDLGL